MFGWTADEQRSVAVLDAFVDGGGNFIDTADTYSVGVATAHSATVAQVALAWIMARPGVTSAIVSATSVEQLQELLDAVNLKLTGEDMATLDLE